MGINKVQYGNTTLIDLTSDTVTADKLMQGYTAHDRTGALITGTATGGGEPNLQAKTYTVDSAGTATVTADSGYDGLSEVEVSVPSATPYIGDATAYFTLSGQRKWRHLFEVAVEVSEGDVAGWLPDGYSQNRKYSCNAVPTNTTIIPTESSQTIGGENYMMEGAVTVNAIPSNYVGSGITQRSSSDLTASGATVTVPSGYYSAQASKAVASGTAGTPTAAKGTVSNHQVSVTPSVTNTAGYISGGTKTGTAVTVSASELVSGTYTVDSSGTKDVTNYASASVPAGTAGTPSASKGTVSNHSVSVTPSVTNTTGWITGSTKSGTAVTVTASELASGNKAITQNGTGIDVVGYSTVSVDVAGAEYTRTVIVPQQTVTPNSSRVATLNTTGTINDAENYIVTLDGVEWFATSETLWSSNYIIGDPNWYTGTPSTYIYPFAVGREGSITDASFANANQHTIKVERLDFVEEGTTLTTKNITANGTYNASSDSADGYSSVTVNVPSGSSKNTQIVQSTTRTNASTLTAIGAELTVSKTGTYDIYYSCFRTNTSSSYTWATRLYINGTAYGTAENATWTNNQQNTHLSNISLTDGDKLRVYGRNTRGTSYYICAPMLVIIEA